MLRDDPPGEDKIPLDEAIANFNRDVSLYEQRRVADIKDSAIMLDALQGYFGLPKTGSLLEKSIQGIEEAETQEEMNVFLQCFLATLDSVTIPNVINIEPCLNILRKSADDLFCYMDACEYDANKAGKNLYGTLQEAQEAVEAFAKEAATMQAYFTHEIEINTKNLERLKNLAQTDEHLREIDRLEKLNLKYQAGIKSLDEHLYHVNKIMELLKRIPNLGMDKELEGEERRKNIESMRDNIKYLITLHELNLIDQMTGYNHFINKCREDACALYQARASYLPKQEEGMLKPVAKAAWLVGSRILHMPVKLDPLPEEFLSFVSEASLVAAEIKHHAGTPIVLGPRTPKLSTAEPKTTFLKKAASVILGATGLAFSAVLCITGIGAPKGIALASLSIGMINTVVDGSDFFTEQRKTINRNNAVRKKLETLEKEYEELETNVKSTPQSFRELESVQRELAEGRYVKGKVMATAHIPEQPKMEASQTAKPRLANSEAVVDRILLGRKAVDVLTSQKKDEMDKLHRETRVPDPIPSIPARPSQAVMDETATDTDSDRSPRIRH